MQDMFELLHALEVPSVCAVHGSVLGGGLELAAFTDLTFASTNATFGQPEIKLGVFPPVAVAYFSQIIGVKHARDLISTGRIIDANQALRIGLVNAVYPDDQLLEKSREVVKMICGHSRAALSVTKRAFERSAHLPTREALRACVRIYRNDLMKTSDAIEGLRAFLEKRKPQWKHS
jgi:enoyl-CoA hydratase/carnithine racemase